MTVRSETRLEMTASPVDIHGYLADVSRWPEWAAGIVSCEVGDGGSLTSGSRLDQKVKKPIGAPGSRTLDVTTVEVPHRLEFAGTMGAAPIRWGFDLTEVDENHAQVLLWIEAEPRGAIRLVPAGVLKGMFRRVNQRELTAIKTRVESERRTST